MKGMMHMATTGLSYSEVRQQLINAVVDAGHELIKNAPIYIGDCELLTSVDITIKLDPSFLPTIEIKQNYICKTAYDRVASR